MGVEVRQPDRDGLLALVESDYGKPPAGATVISLSTWPQYVLDNFATVTEAVADIRKET